jgi:glucose/arabinose dehydrogenase
MSDRARAAGTGLAAAAFLTLGGAAPAAVPPGFTDALVVNVGAPTDVTFTPDGRILVTSQPGTLRVYDQSGTLLGSTAIPSSQICFNSERGLLGAAADPNFASNGFIYLFYTRTKVPGNCSTASPVTSSTPVNRVSRFTMSGSTFDLASEVVLVDNMPSPAGNHNAGDVAFGKDGYLYTTIGDGGCDYAGGGCAGNNNAARDEHVLTGKLLRIAVNPDGSTSIPPTNPFTGAGTARCNVTGQTTPGNRCQETFAWGLRNPFRFALDPNAAGTRLFVNDVGQGSREEIDLGQAGADYGWNCKEGTSLTGQCSPLPPGVVDPIYDYGRGTVPGTTASGCASITGGAFVPNGIWPSAYDNTYLFADYVCGWIFRLSGSGPYMASDFATSLGSSSATSLAFGPFGNTQALYYTTYAGGGQVRRISYAQPGNNAPTAVASGGPLTGPPPLTVDFSAAGSSDPDPGDTLTFFWSFGDGSADVVTTSLTVQHTYTSAGTFTATLRARDNNFAFSSPVTLTVQPGNTPPIPTIQSPAPGATFAVGQTVTLTGGATDDEEGTIPADRLSWTVILHHETHTHPFLGPVTGNNITFTGPAPEDLAAAASSYLEVQLTATDLSSASTTVTRDLDPRTVDLTFATSPPGLNVTVNGTPLTGPETVTSWESYLLTATAPSSQTSGPNLYLFSSWSVGTGNPVNITTPASPATYTATYQLSSDVGPLGFHTLSPCRLVDTRLPAGGGPALVAGATRDFDLNACGVPTTARAMAANVTVVNPTGPGHLRVYPADELRPGTSTINFSAGQTRGTNAVVKLGANGDVSVFCAMASGSTHFVLDVTGYFE